MLKSSGFLVREIRHGYGGVMRFLCRSRRVWFAWTMAFTLTLILLPISISAAEIPQNVTELWSGFSDIDKTTPIAAEILKEWQQDGVVCRIVRYQVGIFKGSPSKVAAFYAFPKGGTKLPALLAIHGGGQSAGLESVFADARRGYASISINWGGNKLNFGRTKMTWDGPQTDWGKLDATHPPQRNKINHFISGALAPDDYTIDSV